MKETLFLFLLAMLIGCQPEPDAQRLYDELVVSTSYDKSADFKAYATYALPTDTIGFVSNSSPDTILVASENSFPRPVLDAVARNMNALGFTRVDRNGSPDLGVNVAVVNDFNVFQEIVYPDPYYYSGGFYPGYYGYGSAYYYPFVNTYAYNTGVVIVELVDLKNKNANNEVRVVWTAYLGDVYSTIDLIPQTEAAIDQAFRQSPYLQQGL
ncbi:MAG TPA: DUF4136 domain-containing protein [Chryseosolibacter sp.]|nr:DUF4136 domain-containing protein [Chryseosolibacter sp.]